VRDIEIEGRSIHSSSLTDTLDAEIANKIEAGDGSYCRQVFKILVSIAHAIIPNLLG
jgi:hypothetical protein